jgi:hypothetical protein
MRGLLRIGEGSDEHWDAPLVQVNEMQLGTLGTVVLACQLTPGLIEHIEAIRQVSDLGLLLKVFVPVRLRQPNINSPSQMIGLDEAMTTMRLNVPRSHWVDRVLPGIGYKGKLLVEYVIPSDEDLAPVFKKALAELEAASTAFVKDQPDQVWVKCRNVLNELLSATKLELEGAASFSNRLKAFREQRLEPVLGVTKSLLVSQQMEAMWSAFSAATKPNSTAIDRRAAKFSLHTTSALLDYVGKVLA